MKCWNSLNLRFDIFWLLLASVSFSFFPLQSFALEPPKLIVVMVIDQFRADYLTRFKSNFLPAKSKGNRIGGFNYLIKNGAYFPFGQHDVAQSMTSPGHATVLTGAYPYQTGIPLNDWYSRNSDQIESSTYDPQSPLVGLTQLNGSKGASPRSLNATTVGDELKNAGFSSQVVSIAIKQSPAILLGGHRADLALWYDSHLEQWVSSQHYLPNHKLPRWAIQFSEESKTITEAPMGSHKLTGYSDSIQTQSDKRHLTKAIHELRLTRLAAERTIKELQLGRHKNPDLLAISFSSHDSMGHALGPNSTEMEQLTYQEDLEISTFLNFIQKAIPGGLKNAVIVLTGDHGVAPIPEWAKAKKYYAERVDENALSEQVISHLNEKFGVPKSGKWIKFIISFNIYLNQKAIQEKALKTSEVEEEVKSFLKKDPRIAQIATASEIGKRILPPGIHERQILHSFYPERSGDLILIFKPYFIPKGLDGAPANHISGYSYDRTVPILISGSHIKPQTYSSRAEVVDIAPTLSFLAGVLPPSLSEGRVLSEIIRTK